jgi:hypothetical protein
MSTSILRLTLSLTLVLSAACAPVVVDSKEGAGGDRSTIHGDGGGGGGGGSGGGSAGPLPHFVVSAHWDHVCAIDGAGALTCWGSNRFGELGIGSDVPFTDAPTAVDAEHRYREVYAGELMTCGLRVDGSLWCWGHDASVDGGANVLVPTRVGLRSDYAQVAVGAKCTGPADCGASFVCAIRADATMDCFQGHFGPDMPITTLDGHWKSVASHFYATLALRDDGDVYRSDNDGVFKLAVPGPFQRVSVGPVDQHLVDDTHVLYRREEPQAFVAIGEHFGGPISSSYRTCAITTGGALFCGDSEGKNTLTQVGSERDWIAIGTGAPFSCGARLDGSIWCWGTLLDGAGQVLRDYGPVPTRL